jgi:hypothetical protein
MTRLAYCPTLVDICSAMRPAWPGAASAPHTSTSMTKSLTACRTWWQVRVPPSVSVLCCAIFGTAPATFPNIQLVLLPLGVVIATALSVQAFHLSADACTNARALSADEKATTDSKTRWAGSSPTVCTTWPRTPR